MRISDWSPDVCSSDLGKIRACDLHLAKAAERLQEQRALGPAAHRPHAKAQTAKLLHDIAAEEARSPRDGHQPVGLVKRHIPVRPSTDFGSMHAPANARR